MKNNDVHHYTIAPQIVWEAVGSEVVILDTTSHTTHRLAGEQAAAFLAAAQGQPIAPQEVMALQERGFLEPRSPMSRRALVTGGVAGLGLGLTSLALPIAAAATSTTLTPTITAASLVAGEWRWTPTMAGIDITQTKGSVLLQGLDAFQVGDRWRLSLVELDGEPRVAEADVVLVSGTLYQLTFSFPVTNRPSDPTILQGTLTKVADPTVFSEQFPIPKLGTTP